VDAAKPEPTAESLVPNGVFPNKSVFSNRSVFLRTDRFFRTGIIHVSVGSCLKIDSEAKRRSRSGDHKADSEATISGREPTDVTDITRQIIGAELLPF